MTAVRRRREAPEAAAAAAAPAASRSTPASAPQRARPEYPGSAPGPRADDTAGESDPSGWVAPESYPIRAERDPAPVRERSMCAAQRAALRQPDRPAYRANGTAYLPAAAAAVTARTARTSHMCPRSETDGTPRAPAPPPARRSPAPPDAAPVSAPGRSAPANASARAARRAAPAPAGRGRCAAAHTVCGIVWCRSEPSSCVLRGGKAAADTAALRNITWRKCCLRPDSVPPRPVCFPAPRSCSRRGRGCWHAAGAFRAR